MFQSPHDPVGNIKSKRVLKNSQLRCQRRGRGDRKAIRKLRERTLLPLLLFGRPVVASSLVSRTRTQHAVASNVTLSSSHMTAGNVTVSPWSMTISNMTTTSMNSINIITTANATANHAENAPSSCTPIQLIVANRCGESIWPGIVTQNGIGPGTGGFELTPGTSRTMFVSPDWAGRIWGRTNCSFNADGSGPNTYSGVDGYGAACVTGDCLGKLDCPSAVSHLSPEVNKSPQPTNQPTRHCRAEFRPLSPNSLSRVAVRTIKPSTTSPS